MQNDLINQYLNPQKPMDYNTQLLTSYAGYPVKSARELGLMDYFKGDGKQVGGMAWGGNTNPPGQGGGDSSSIVPNPYMYKTNPDAQNALVKLEASRHWMNENDYKPKFEITPAMQKWREEQFSNIGPAGDAYLKDDNAFRQTLISRSVGGDSNMPEMTKSFNQEAQKVKSTLEQVDASSRPTISDQLQNAINLK